MMELKQPIWHELEGKYVSLHLSNAHLIGQVGEFDSGTLRLLGSPTKIYDKTGTTYVRMDRYLDAGAIVGHEIIGREKIDSFMSEALPLRKYLGMPVCVKDGGDNYGVVNAVHDTDIMLIPCLVAVPSKDGPGKVYRWERKMPLTIRNPQTITPCRMNDLERMIEVSKQKADLDLRQLEIHLADLKAREQQSRKTK